MKLARLLALVALVAAGAACSGCDGGSGGSGSGGGGAPGPTWRLAFVQQPTDALAGPSNLSVTLHVLSEDGALAAPASAFDDVNLSVASGPGGLHGSSTAQVVGGVASFGGLGLTTAGSYTLRASGPGLVEAISQTFTISPGTAVAFAVGGLPGQAVAGTAYALTVTAVDSFGNRTPWAGTVGFASSDPQATLPASVTLTAADAGATTAPGLLLRSPGTHSVTASGGGLTGTQQGVTVVRIVDVTQVTPDRGPVEGGTTLEVRGAGFGAGAVVRVGGVAAADVMVVDDGRLTCEAPVGVLGVVDVEVEMPGAPAAVAPGAYAYEGFEPERLLPATLGKRRLPQDLPAVAMDGALAIAVWHDPRLGSSDLFFRRSTDGGLTWSPDARLNAPAVGWRFQSSVAISGPRVVVAWTDSRGGPWDIYVKTSVDGGATWAPEVRLNEDVGLVLRLDPVVAVSGDRVVVGWQDQRSGDADIYVKTSADGGATWTADVRLNSDSTTSIQDWPAVGLSGDQVIVAWRDDRHGHSDIYYRRSADLGMTWTADARLNTNVGTTAQSFPALGRSGDLVVAAWTDAADICYRTSADGGETWSAVAVLSTSTTGSRTRATVSASGDRVVVAWVDTRTGTMDIRTRTSADGGATWSADARLNEASPPGSHDVPAAALSGDRVVVVWAGNRDGDWDIYHRTSADGGATWTADERLNDGLEPLPQDAPVVVRTASGRIVSAWVDQWGHAYYDGHVVTRTSADGGLTWSSPTRLDEDATDPTRYWPTLAGSGERVLVAWRDRREGGPDLRHCTSADGGLTWSSHTRLNGDPLTGAMLDRPAVGLSGDRAIAAWAGDAGSGVRILFRRSDDGGATWSADASLDSAGPWSGQSSPAVGLSGDLAVVGWTDDRLSGTRGVYVRTSADGGVTWTPDERLDQGTQPVWVAVGVSGARVVVAWDDVDQGERSIHYRTSADGGQMWSTVAVLSTSTARHSFPSVAIAQSRVAVAWSREQGGQEDVVYRTSGDGGSTWSPETTLNTVGTNRRFMAQVHVAPDGEVHAVWADWREGAGRTALRRGFFRP
ncbi:MAG: exo-alpha-sialidase [Planctomycetes bacterium]|nr:exo-alpha-sialidase [Planctomycetota bacterium]